jgi:hypothetical protein
VVSVCGKQFENYVYQSSYGKAFDLYAWICISANIIKLILCGSLCRIDRCGVFPQQGLCIMSQKYQQNNESLNDTENNGIFKTMKR